jgi:hypothetical protein
VGTLRKRHERRMAERVGRLRVHASARPPVAILRLARLAEAASVASG